MMTDPVFAPSVSQSIALLSATVHNTGLPYRVRQVAALILLLHLRAERDQLLQERSGSAKDGCKPATVGPGGVELGRPLFIGSEKKFRAGA